MLKPTHAAALNALKAAMAAIEVAWADDTDHQDGHPDVYWADAHDAVESALNVIPSA